MSTDFDGNVLANRMTMANSTERTAEQDRNYEEFQKRSDEKQRKKDVRDALIEKLVEAERRGDKKTVAAIRAQLAKDVPQTKEEILEDIENIEDDAKVFMKGVLGMSQQEADKVIDDAYYQAVNNLRKH